MKIDSKIKILVIAAVTTPTIYYYYTFKKNKFIAYFNFHVFTIFVTSFISFLFPLVLIYQYPRQLGSFQFLE